MSTGNSSGSSGNSTSSGGGGGHGGSSGGIPAWLNTPWRGYQVHQREDYPKQVWMFVASGIGFLILSNVIYLIRSHSRRDALMRNASSEGTKVEAEGSNGVAATPASPSKPASWRRLPLAMEAAFKIAAFRWTIPFGRTYVLNFAEIFFTAGYLAACLIWSFVHCTYIPSSRQPSSNLHNSTQRR